MSCSLALFVATLIFAPAAPVALAPDFFVAPATTPLTFVAARSKSVQGDPGSCRSQIGRALCVLAPSSAGTESLFPPASRRCEPDKARYVAFFEEVFDRFPAALQQTFCSVRTLYVQPHLESIAYASTGFGDGAIVGVRRSMIDEALALSTVVSWKEQLIFGGMRDSYTLREDLPRVDFVTKHTPVEDLAYYVLAHEFGHLLDFANGISAACAGAPCEAESFGANSWETLGTVAATSDFAHRAEVCYYHCKDGPLAREAVIPLYEGLQASNFITLYAATNTYDDFAESLAFFLLARQPDASVRLDTRQSIVYDLLHKVNSPVFAAKASYIDSLLQQPALRYP